MFSMYFHRFPTCYQSIEINIRKTYGVPTTGHQQKFEKAYVVPVSIPQVKTMELPIFLLMTPASTLPFVTPSHNQHTNYFICMVTGVYVTLTCVWELPICLPQLENQLVDMFRLRINTITVSVISILYD